MRFFRLGRSLFRLRPTSGEWATVRAWVFIRAQVAYMSKMLFHPCFKLFDLADDRRLDLVRSEELLVLSWVAPDFLFSRPRQALHRVDLCLVCSEAALGEVGYRAWHFHSLNARLALSCHAQGVKILLAFVDVLHLFDLWTLGALRLCFYSLDTWLFDRLFSSHLLQDCLVLHYLLL